MKKCVEEYDRLTICFDLYTDESKVGKKRQDFVLED